MSDQFNDSDSFKHNPFIDERGKIIISFQILLFHLLYQFEDFNLILQQKIAEANKSQLHLAIRKRNSKVTKINN